MSGAETFRASAEVYDRHIGRYGAPLADALIDFAGVEHGMRVLDVGCGPGALTAALARRVGGANVRGADPSEPFAAACAERLASRSSSRPRRRSLPKTVRSTRPFPNWSSTSCLGDRPGRAAAADDRVTMTPSPTGIAPSGAFCKSLDEGRRSALRDALERRLSVGAGPSEAARARVGGHRHSF